MPRHDWTKSIGPPPIRLRDNGDFLTDKVKSSWLAIDGLCRPAGRARDRVRQQMTDRFGADRWYQAWWLGKRLIGREEALSLYEEAYLSFLKAEPSLAGWLCETACEVYDNNVSNIDSGLDYSVQETDADHLQDIAVRRCLLRLGLRLAGSELIQIRGPRSVGYVLDPGRVPFHMPAMILDRAEPGWWEPGTVEAFWQHNKTLLVSPESLILTPLILGEEGLWGQLDGQMAVLIQRGNKRHLRAAALSDMRALWSGVTRSHRKHARIRGATPMSYAVLASLRLPEMQQCGAVTLLWDDLQAQLGRNPC
jgi:hypothetical protein